MNQPLHYNTDENLAAMRQDIADRAFKVKLKGMLVAGAFAALAVGAIFVFPTALGAAAPILGLVGAAGSAIAGLATMKEAKKLEIDEQYLETRMQGGNWWGGYRREVMDHGQGHQAPHTPLVDHGHHMHR